MPHNNVFPQVGLLFYPNIFLYICRIWGPVPYLFDCKPRLIKLFSSFRGAYDQRQLTFTFYLIERKRWRFSLATFFSNKLSFRILFSSLRILFSSIHILFSSLSRAYPSQEGLRWSKGSYSGV